ncbi:MULTISPECIES: IclR family transcriptional regulator [Heyndrickxia]|uniref:IclR family transcriptional regulator n=1 Tax=Heyndrickxia TaxID=2837504 RepID=UPI001459834B|nr:MULTISPECIES: IclR family transcriptional regulator [Heyndrickxia]MEC2306405.1 IclR family transcriptional regulator [Weizmannia sp. CD-2023]MEC2340988.1 IclR family transcriptional regulator [Weizmannia sp. CD-2023]NMH83364.1 IclR family transcriptional regulator [Heyndrickxia coagulans]
MDIIKNGSTIQSLQVGNSILDALSKQRRPLKFSDIQELTGITKSNLYKYLNTFVQLGILYKDDAGLYTFGPKLIEYGMAAVDQENVLDRVVPFLEKLNHATRCSTLFAVWTPEGPMIIKLVNSNPGFNIGAQIGTIPPLASAVGKIFLAFMDQGTIREWKERESAKLDHNVKADLEKEIRSVRKQKIAFAKEPILTSVSSIAIPVFNYKKTLLGAIAVVGFSEQIPAAEEEDAVFITDIKKTGFQVSQAFGYSEDPVTPSK